MDKDKDKDKDKSINKCQYKNTDEGKDKEKRLG